MRATELWPPIIADAKASLGDLRALANYHFDALAAVLPNVRIQELPGQAHEGLTTAPEMYAEAVTGFLLESHAEVNA